MLLTPWWWDLRCAPSAPAAVGLAGPAGVAVRIPAGPAATSRALTRVGLAPDEVPQKVVRVSRIGVGPRAYVGEELAVQRRPGRTGRGWLPVTIAEGVRLTGVGSAVERVPVRILKVRLLGQLSVTRVTPGEIWLGRVGRRARGLDGERQGRLAPVP